MLNFILSCCTTAYTLNSVQVCLSYNEPISLKIIECGMFITLNLSRIFSKLFSIFVMQLAPCISWIHITGVHTVSGLAREPNTAS